MSRIRPLETGTAPKEAGPLFEQDLEAHGQVLNTTRIASYRPGIASAARQLGQAVALAGLIPEQLRLLMNVRIAGLVGCPF